MKRNDSVPRTGRVTLGKGCTRCCSLELGEKEKEKKKKKKKSLRKAANRAESALEGTYPPSWLWRTIHPCINARRHSFTPAGWLVSLPGPPKRLSRSSCTLHAWPSCCSGVGKGVARSLHTLSGQGTHA